jgi:3-methyladenine DNA glycosylase AlkD
MAEALPSVKEAAAWMLQELEARADAERARSSQRFFKEPITCLGIDAPTMRRLAKEWVRRVHHWELAQAEALCDVLMQHPAFEASMLGILVLGGFRKTYDRDLFFRIEPWVLHNLTNWALVDGFCSEVLSPLLAKHGDLERELPRWMGDSSLWMRRAALVALVPFARKGQRLDRVYELAVLALPSAEDLMHKALGWLLREAGKTDAQRLETFLRQHCSQIPRTSVRYAIERFPETQRKHLLEATRS